MEINALTLIMFAILIFSVVLHEVAHGYVAFLLGDPTAKNAERLTLNPVGHIDPLGSVILPAVLILTGSRVLFGWAKPVPINPGYFRDPVRGMMAVGAAGPGTNLALAFAGAALIKAIPLSGLLTQALVYLCVINVILAVFNLIPIPPLDGSRIVMGILPRELASLYAKLEPYGMFIVIGFLFLGGIRLISPVVETLLEFLSNGA